MRRELQAEPAQGTKESPRIADPGHRMELPPDQRRSGTTSRRIAQRVKIAGFEHHVEGGQRGRQRQIDSAVADHRIDRIQPRQRFAQRAQRQTPAVTGGAAIEDRQFDVAGQLVMLQAVVAEHNINFRMRGQQGGTGSSTVATDPDRHTAATRQQQRLVAHRSRAVFRVHRRRCLALTAVTATDDARAQPPRQQLLCQPQRQRRLAGTADRDVANNHDRHRQAATGGITLSALRNQTKQRVQRQQQRQQKPQRRRQPALLEPLSLQPACQHQCGVCVAKEMCG